ncbi:MAG TPA: hypothetical protein VIO11_01560, partial [Candidatus Methanoperedens sp.]
MEDIRNRARFLGILIAIGLILSAIAYATGISEQLQTGLHIRLTAVIDRNNGTINLIQNDKIMQTIKLPERVEGVEYFYDEKSRKTSIKYMTDEQAGRQRDERKKILDSAIRIAISDEKVEQLIAGREFTIPISGLLQDSKARIILKIDKKYYEVVVNLLTEEVIRIEEVKESNIF